MRTLLEAIPHDDAALDSALQKIQRRPVIINERALMDRLPNIPLSFLEENLENFGKLYTNLTLKKTHVNVFENEFAKRVVLHQSLQPMAGRVGSIYSQRLQLLFLLSPKTFIVALYAATQKCVCRSLTKTTIFDTRPSLGTDVTYIFREHLTDFYRKGCLALDLLRSFTDSLRSDCVSIHELKFLVSLFS